MATIFTTDAATLRSLTRAQLANRVRVLQSYDRCPPRFIIAAQNALVQA